MGNYARDFRVLTGCRGKPAVLVLCHPVKAASKDNLLPRGGGAFLNEVDVNLTLWAEAQGETSTLHWQGKIRGVDFQSVNLALRPVKLEKLCDAKGRPFVSVVAPLQTEEQAAKAISQAATDENIVLQQLRDAPGIFFADIARNAGWLTDTAQPQPKKSKVHRLIKSLEKSKLVRNWRGDWRITDEGKKELNGVPVGTAQTTRATKGSTQHEFQAEPAPRPTRKGAKVTDGL
jgi:hypothetical protein